MRQVPISPVFAVLLACACGGAQRQTPAAAPASPAEIPAVTPAAAECDARAERVHALYLGALEREPADLRDELADANTEMVLADCRRDPARRVPCIDRAQTVAALEAECVAPLDDAGRVEQRQLGDGDG